MIWKDVAELQYDVDDKYSRGNNGKLDWESQVKPLMIKYLDSLEDLYIEIYE